MKNTFTTFLLLFFFLFQNQNVTAQWNFSEGMDEVSCQSLVVLDSILFACTGSNGIYARNISGGEWHQKIAAMQFHKILKAGEVLFAQTYNQNYRSMDQGETWEMMDSLLGQGDLQLQMTAIDSTIFFLGGSVHRSDDYGETYHTVFTYPLSLGGLRLYSNDQTLFLIGNNNQYHLYYSLDAGSTWDSLSNNGLPLSFSPKDIYNYNNDFWLAMNWGWPGDPPLHKWNPNTQTWEPSDSIGVIHFGTYNNMLHAGGMFGFYRFDPGTGHWIKLNGTIDNLMVRDFCSSDSSLFCGGDAGIYRSGPSYNWSVFHDGLHQAIVWNYSTFDDEVWVITSYGLYKSTDFGGQFDKQMNPHPTHPLKILLTASEYYMLSYEGFSSSSDNGNSWVTSNTGLPTYLDPIDLECNNTFLFLATNHDLYRSLRTVISWQKITNDSTLTFEDIVCDDSVILATVYNTVRFLLRSSDEGLTFSTIWYDCYNLFNTNQNLFGIYYNAIISQSFDEGLTWVRIPFPDSIHTDFMSLTQNEFALIVSSYGMEGLGNYLFLTYNNGGTWTDIRANLPNPNTGWMGPVETHEGRILSGVFENGLWYRDDLLTGIKEVIPKKNETLKISPNPASDKIIVTIDIEKDESGWLQINDITGRTVYDGGIKEYLRGAFRTSVDIQHLDDGLYIISYNTNGKRVYGKFVKTVR